MSLLHQFFVREASPAYNYVYLVVYLRVLGKRSWLKELAIFIGSVNKKVIIIRTVEVCS